MALISSSANSSSWKELLIFLALFMSCRHGWFSVQRNLETILILFVKLLNFCTSSTRVLSHMARMHSNTVVHSFLDGLFLNLAFTWAIGISHYWARTSLILCPWKICSAWWIIGIISAKKYFVEISAISSASYEVNFLGVLSMCKKNLHFSPGFRRLHSSTATTMAIRSSTTEATTMATITTMLVLPTAVNSPTPEGIRNLFLRRLDLMANV